jgi:hypothetical protein
MASKREIVEKRLMYFINKLDPTGFNKAIMLKKLESMSDSEFASWIDDLEHGRDKIRIYAPNMIVNLKRVNAIAVLQELKIPITERIKIWDPLDERYMMPDIEYLIIRIPVRRLKQDLVAKRSIPTSDTAIDLFTGQVRKPDKGSSISAPEASVILSRGLVNSAVELISIRGGNVAGYAEFKGMLIDTGQVSTKDVNPETRATSADTVRSLLQAMMIDNNL